MKKGVLLLALFLLGSFIAPVFAETPTLDKTITDIQNNPDALSNVSYNYLADQWKEVLLKNYFISVLDSFFTKINWLFVILFARSWSLSLEMAIVFLVWIFTFFSVLSYARVKTKGWTELGIALAATILVGYTQVYNVIAKVAIKIVFFKQSWIWSLLSALILFVVLYLYLYFNKLYSRAMLKSKEDSHRKDLEAEVEASKEFRKELSS